MTEKQFETKIKKYLDGLPKTWHVKVWGGGFQKAGIPDILACVNGHFVGIEVKAETGKASELQKRNVRLINEARGLAFIVYPSQFDALKFALESLYQEGEL